jgi:hypothetical protein
VLFGEEDRPKGKLDPVLFPQDAIFSMRSVLTDEKPFHIFSLAQVNLADPFASETNDHFKVPIEPDDYVYHSSRFNVNARPHCLYIPSRKLMFDIMRVCVNLAENEKKSSE